MKLNATPYYDDDEETPPHNVNKGLAKGGRIRVKGEGGGRSWSTQTWQSRTMQARPLPTWASRLNEWNLAIVTD